MSAITPLMPRQPVPDLEVATVGGGTWRLKDQKPENFTMIVFYRGLHCPICSRYLADLNRKVASFAEKGVNTVVVSSDSRDRATTTKESWDIGDLTVGYGLDLDTAREWGLYISAGVGKTSTGVEEPALFNEPAIYLVKPDGTLYFGSVQTMPFARPSFAELLQAVDFVTNVRKGYPARGEIIDHKAVKVA